MNFRSYSMAVLGAIATVAAILTATVVLHESGHFTTGNLIGCKDVEVRLLDDKLETYTQMNCGAISKNEIDLIAAGGLLFVIPLSLLLFFFNKKAYSLAVFGFNLVVSSSDFSIISSTFTPVFMLAGAASVLYAEILLTNRYIEYLGRVEQSYSKNR